MGEDRRRKIVRRGGGGGEEQEEGMVMGKEGIRGRGQAGENGEKGKERGRGGSGGGDGEKEAFNINELLVCVEGWVDCLVYGFLKKKINIHILLVYPTLNN